MDPDADKDSYKNIEEKIASDLEIKNRQKVETYTERNVSAAQYNNTKLKLDCATHVVNGSRSSIANPFMAKIKNLVESYCGTNGLEFVNSFDARLLLYMYRPTR